MSAIVKTDLNALLADCGTIDIVSWHPPASMTYEQWAEIGRQFQYVNGSLNWWLGDWLNEGEKRYGETYAQAIEVTGHKIDYLMKIKSVSKRIKIWNRFQILSWTHHYHVAHLDEQAQRQLLRFAGEHGLSSRDLLDAVRDYERNIGQIEALPETPTAHSNGYAQEEIEDEPPFADKEYYSEAEIADHLAGNLDGYDWEEEPDEQIPDDATKPHVAHNSANNEWYTPLEYINAARQVMGDIDLDPASSDIANEVVQAETYYTLQDDGLRHPWFGRVWMNPPYAKGVVDAFTEKLVRCYQDGDVEEAIVLVNNATETAWFRPLIAVASAVVFPFGRVRFWRPDGETGDPLQGQAVIYLGDQANKFKNAYSVFGWGAIL